MPIAGTVQITGQLAPTAASDVFATHAAIYALGGAREVADAATRNAFGTTYPARISKGMLIVTQNDNLCWQLNTATPAGTSADWTAFGAGGGFANPMTAVGDIIVGGVSGAATRLAATTNGWVLTLASGTPAWVAAGGGGLVHWNELETTAAPYTAAASGTSFKPNTTATDSDALLVPKGVGSVGAAIANNLTSGGNVRGQQSVDWQLKRTFPAAVASGAFSNISGGQDNETDAASDSGHIGGGNANIITAGSRGTIGGGFNNTMNSTDAWIPGGQRATSRGIVGKGSWGAGFFGTGTGDSQAGELPCRAFTASATPAPCTTSGGAASSSNIDVMPNHSAYTGLFLVSSHIDVANSAGWVLSAHIVRGVGPASTVVVGQTTLAHWTVGTGSTWAATIVADATNGGFYCQITGDATGQTYTVVRHLTIEGVG